MLQNNGTTTYAIRDGNAQSGGLTTEYSGPLPDIGGYTPMHQEGAVLLGTGGDDSNGSDGTFLEGVITAGYPTQVPAADPVSGTCRAPAASCRKVSIRTSNFDGHQR
jgi:Alpha-L-arabinofuranosidase B, catalytic